MRFATGFLLASMFAFSGCLGGCDGGGQNSSSTPPLSAPEPARFGSSAPVRPYEEPMNESRQLLATGPAAPLEEGRRSTDEEFAASLGSENRPAPPKEVAGAPVLEPEDPFAQPRSAPAASAAPKAFLYTNLEWCVHCRTLEAKLQAKPHLRQRFQEAGDRPPGGGGIPALVVGGRVVRGPDAIIAALEALGP